QTQQQAEKGQIENAGQEVAKHKTKKKKILNACMFVLNIVIVAGILWYQLAHEEVASPDYLFSQGSMWYLFLVFGCFGAVMALDTFRTNAFMKKCIKRSRLGLSYKVVVIGKYYDAVTPMSSGEPFQVFYLNNRGLNASSALSVPVARYVFSQFAWMIVSVVSIFCAINFNIAETGVVSVASYIGFALNATLLLLALTISLSKRVGTKLVAKCLRLLQKIRIIKNYEKQYERVMKVVSGYQTTMNDYAKAKGMVVLHIFISILIFIINYSIPFVIYLMFGGTDLVVWPKMIVLSAMIELASSFIPLPGGSGMSEISFTVLFAPYFSDGTIFWALLLNRFMTYYIYLIQGIMVIIYDYVIGNKRYVWQKRKWELEAESVLFKEQQLKNYKKKKKTTKTM
ncbi:MAG: flippase-like domain-containing protein, partial [Clostridia bacterium]|nr:flippase-like domain-containing protein [Clostridia bacterium]